MSMKVTTIVGLCLLLAGAWAETPSPVVAWSANPDHLGGSVRSIRPDLRQPESLADFLSTELTQGSRDLPEVLVVFTSAEGGQRGAVPALSVVPSLQARMLSGGASVTVPGVDAAATLRSLEQKVPSIQVTGPSGAVELVSAPGVGSNGECEVVVCQVPSSGDAGPAVKLLVDTLERSTRGNFAVVMTLENRFALTPEFEAALEIPSAHARRLSSASSTQGVRMTPDILAGLLTGILLTVIALTGLCCLGSIQTPTKFSDVPPPSTREY
uniref:V-type proton ATPase subunit S1/VOA1 transmembrane domain-containing protein n=1 Tax=Rhizochromulina marina TaxID=1034831 RepID=A0A7S2WS17_9STRA|mmetsp:Transcript_32501/g.94151  ORF Transcript_32501/g.94151 Transcript_32501/m.94151 type:complete len:269 (+) Transcript_32501:121-927(+)